MNSLEIHRLAKLYDGMLRSRTGPFNHLKERPDQVDLKMAHAFYRGRLNEAGRFILVACQVADPTGLEQDNDASKGGGVFVSDEFQAPL